jgi:L-asparaginase / beta-aspartyl-peptidase
MTSRLSILIHGGAGIAWPDEDQQACRDGAAAAAQAGYAVLEKGGSALDAVEAAVIVLENDPHFNAGTGSTLTSEGTVECDASVMTSGGQDGACGGAVHSARGACGGAVASVKTVKNPVRLARKVMEATPHLLLAGAGAEAFARAHGLTEIDNAALITNRARARFEAERKKPGPASRPSERSPCPPPRAERWARWRATPKDDWLPPPRPAAPS